MAFTVENAFKFAIFIDKRGKVMGVAERTSGGPETLNMWVKVPDESVDTNPLPDKIRDFEPVTFLRTSDTALAPPSDFETEVLGSNCYYVIQGGKAYKICR